MQDRVPLYPGRVTLTPVSGQANTFDLTRADQPTQEGTPLNKSSLLKDTTAALFGKTNAAVPDDILSKLSKSALSYTEEKYTKTTIGTLAVGKTITLNVSGTPTEFIVVHQGNPSSLYDDSCNGTWLLMKGWYEKHEWNSSNSNSYKESTIHSYLNSTFLNMFDSSIKDAIKQVKIPYVNGTGDSAVASGANGLPVKIFLLSGYEEGLTVSDSQYLPQDGAKLSYFEYGVGDSARNKRTANKPNEGYTTLWLRSPYTEGTTTVWYIDTGGRNFGSRATGSYGIRPALILPSTFVVYTDSSGNIYNEQKYETKITDVLGNLIAIPASQIKDGVKIATGSYTGTGTYGSSNPNSLTFEFEPKLVLVNGDSQYGLIAIKDCTISLASTSNMVQRIIWNNKTVSWFTAALNPSGSSQYNGAGNTYYYVAIG